MALLSMRSPVARYLLGDLNQDESQRMEAATLCNNDLTRELEVAEEELIASYAVGVLRGEYRRKFENTFLSLNDWRSAGRKLKLEFAVAWLEKGWSASPDLNSPFHRYILDDMKLDEEAELAEKLLLDEHSQRLLEAAEDEMLIAYFHDRLPGYEKELFETNFLVNDLMIKKLRFAQIMREYVNLASMAPSLVVGN